MSTPTPDLFNKETKPTSKPFTSLPPQGVPLNQFPSIMADAKSGKEYKPCPPGTHLGSCFQVVDIGTNSGEWMGKMRNRRCVRLVFEVSEELMESGKPFSLGRKYTLSLNKKAVLRAHLESWRGRPFTEQELLGFDISSLLGVPCLITVTNEPSKDDPSRMYASIQNISGLVKGMKKVPLVNQLLCYSVSQGRSHPTFSQLPEWLQKECEGCLEWQSAPATMETVPQPSDVDDLPDDDPSSSIPF